MSHNRSLSSPPASVSSAPLTYSASSGTGSSSSSSSGSGSGTGGAAVVNGASNSGSFAARSASGSFTASSSSSSSSSSSLSPPSALSLEASGSGSGSVDDGVASLDPHHPGSSSSSPSSSAGGPSSSFQSLSKDELISRLTLLSQQFAKAKASNNVLKKAVIAEQSNVSALKGSLLSKDQDSRKLVEEIDMLRFHNSHLTKRVEVLQFELDASKDKSHSKTLQANPSVKAAVEGLRVTEEELFAKIQENEGLHMKMFELTRQHKDAVEQLQGEVRRLTRQAEGHDAAVAELKKAHAAVVETLASEKSAADKLNDALKQTSDKQALELASLRRQLAEAEAKLSKATDQSAAAIASRIVFDDAALPHLTVFNSATPHRERLLALRQACVTFAPLLKEHSDVFAEICSSISQRVKIFPSDGSLLPTSFGTSSYPSPAAAAAIKKLVAISSGGMSVFSDVERAAQGVQASLEALLVQSAAPSASAETCIEMNRRLARAVHGFSGLAVKVTRAWSTVLEEETLMYDPQFVDPSAASSGAAAISNFGARNAQVIRSLAKMSSLYEKIASHVKLYANCADPFFSLSSAALPSSSKTGGASGLSSANLVVVNAPFVVKQLTASFSDLHACIKALATHFISKASLEQGNKSLILSTGFVSSNSVMQLKPINDSITASLAGFVNVCAKVGNAFAEKAPLLSSTPFILPQQDVTALPLPLLAPASAAQISFLSPQSLAQSAAPNGAPVSSVILSALEARSRAYLSAVNNIPEPESVPYAQAIANSKIVQFSASSSDSLYLQIATAKERIAFLEQEKEQLMLEHQLTVSQLGKDREKIKELEGEVAHLTQSVSQQQAALNKLVQQQQQQQQQQHPANGAQDKRATPLPLQANPDGALDDFGEMVSASPSLTGLSSAGSVKFSMGSDGLGSGESAGAPAFAKSMSIASALSDDSAGSMALPAKHGLAGDAPPSNRASMDLSAVSIAPSTRSSRTHPTFPERVRRIQFALVGAQGEKHIVDRLPMSEDDASREDLIKKHFATRIAQLTEQLQVAESKANAFHLECKSLLAKMDVSERAKAAVLAELEEANAHVVRLKDELATTERSYGQQIQVMTEHIASMNEQLSSRDDQIEAYRKRMQQGQQQALQRRK